MSSESEKGKMSKIVHGSPASTVSTVSCRIGRQLALALMLYLLAAVTFSL